MASKLGEAYLELSVRTERFRRSVNEAQSYFITRWDELQKRAVINPSVNVSKSGRLGGQMQSAMNAFNAQTARQIKQTAAAFGQAWNQKASQVRAFSNKANAALNSFHNRQSVAVNRMSGMWGTALSGIGMGGAAAFAAVTAAVWKLADAFSELVKRGLMVGDELIRQQVMLEKLTGSIVLAKSMLSGLVDLDVKTPFNVGELSKVTTELIATGAVAQYRILPTVRAIADAAAGSAMGMEALPRIARAFAQMLAKGKIQAQEMTLQLGNAGIPAWKLLADTMGLSVAQVMKMSEEGKLGLKEINMLIDAVAKKYGGMAEEITKRSPSAALESLQSQLSIIISQVSGPLLQAFVKAANAVKEMFSSDTMQSLVGAATRFAEMVAKAFEFFATTKTGLAIVAVVALATAFTAVSVAIAGVVVAAVAFPAIGIGIAAIAGAVVGLLPQMALLAAGIVAVGAAFMSAFNSPEGAKLRANILEIKTLLFEISSNIAKGLIASFEIIGKVVAAAFGADFHKSNVGFWTWLSEKIREILDLLSLFTTNFEKGFILAMLSIKLVFMEMVDDMLQKIYGLTTAIEGAANRDLQKVVLGISIASSGAVESKATKAIRERMAALAESIYAERDRQRAIRASNDAARQLSNTFGGAVQDAANFFKAPLSRFKGGLGAGIGQNVGAAAGMGVKNLVGRVFSPAAGALGQHYQLTEEDKKKIEEMKKSIPKAMTDLWYKNWRIKDKLSPFGIGREIGRFGGGLAGLAGKVGKGVAVGMKGGEGPGAAEFTGIAEMSKRIQMGIFDAEKRRHEKAMEDGLKGIKDGVGVVAGEARKIVDAVKDWIPRAS